MKCFLFLAMTLTMGGTAFGAEKGKAIWLHSPTMPRLSAEAVYDRQETAVTITLYNAEPQEFTFGYEYFLQKWNGTEWKEVDMRRVDRPFPMP